MADYDENISYLMEENEIKVLKEQLEKVKKDIEYEISFLNVSDINNPITFDVFTKLIKYMRFKEKKLKKGKLIRSNTLDISASVNKENYRLSISGIDNINNILKKENEWSNDIIFHRVLTRYVEDDKNIDIMKKKRLNVFDIKSLGLRNRLSSEDSLTKSELNDLLKLKDIDKDNIQFRIKDRLSLEVYNDKKTKIIIDLTLVKQSKNINKINDSFSIYELEVEVQSDKKPESKIFDNVLDEVEGLMKVVQGSKYLLNSEDIELILTTYRGLFGLLDPKTLEGRKPITLEVQHLMENLRTSYAVTDKADGERYFLFLVNGEVYLMSNNLRIKRAGIFLSDENLKYDNTIMDGEYIFLKKENRSTFMVFDCLYYCGKDLRGEKELNKRLSYADDVISKVFVFDKQKNYLVKEYNKKDYKIDKIIEHYEKEIDNYIDALLHDIQIDKKHLLVRRKLFIPVIGISNTEIFNYSLLLWRKYVIDSNKKFPYILDGLIYQPLNEEYNTKPKNIKNYDYKWKPPNKNSIDFYITFLKDKKTNEILTVYDNSNDEYIKGKPYKIAHLHVGKKGGDNEYPVLFRSHEDLHIAYIFLEDGEVRDIEGNILEDKTVVEFYYNNDPTVNEYHRWTPIRTRHDKTEMVKKYGIQYGNYHSVADLVWRSIKNPVTINDIQLLSDDKTYEKHINSLTKKVTHDIIISERKEDVYYQIKTNVGKPMRSFHNFIKSVIIYTYCNKIYNRDEQMDVLDFACGRGGDIMRFYHAKVKNYVGIDVDENGLISPVDGAISRYNKMKNVPNFPKMTFIHADATTILDPDIQNKSLNGTTSRNISLMQKFFSIDKNKRKMFDVINCQFAFHYFLENETKWANVLKNINMYLKPNGFLLLSCFDADQVNNLFGDNKDTFTAEYTDVKGNKRKLFEIIKKYPDKKGKYFGVGNAIDVFNSMVSREDTYITEYLVDMKFLEKELYEKCNLEMVDSDLFENIFHVYRDFFKFVVPHENNKKTGKFLEDVSKFYDQKNSENKASFQMSRLNRYYIFRKKNTTMNKQKGGSINDLSLLNDYIISDIDDNSNSNTFMGSIIKILKQDEIIPDSVSDKEFVKDFKLPKFDDELLTEKIIKNICKKLVVEHINEDDSKKIVLKCPNIIIIRNDCNLEVEGYNYKKINKKNPYIVILHSDNIYKPILKQTELGYSGLFESESSLIKKLISLMD